MSTTTEPAQPIPLVERRTWKELKSHYKKARAFSLRKLFKDDPKRGERLTLEAVGLFLDYSRK
jgi:glucose-6-phosphate isomerase